MESRRRARARSNPSGTCSGATTTLAPGQIATFGGTYTVTQANIDHGSIVDTATAKGNPPSGREVVATSSIVTVDVIDSPSLTLVKSANPTTVTAAGQSVTYTFTVTNTGNLTLTNVGVTDVPTAPAGGISPTCQSLSSPAGTCSGATTTLVPGQVATFTAVYAVTQADVDNGSIADSGRHRGHHPVEFAGHRRLQPGHGRRHRFTLGLHRQICVTHHSDSGRSDDRLHLRGHQHRQPDAHRRGRHRRPDRARGRRHGDLPEPHLAGRDLLGRSDDAGAGPNRDLRGHLYGHADRHRPRLHHRPRHDPGHHPLGRDGGRAPPTP